MTFTPTMVRPQCYSAAPPPVILILKMGAVVGEAHSVWAQTSTQSEIPEVAPSVGPSISSDAPQGG